MDERERISHVVRRLSLGVYPERVENAESVEDAIAAMLDLSAPPPVAPTLPEPTTYEEATEVGRLREPARWWLGQTATTSRPLEERLVWFWMDHFATAAAKVRSADLMWQNHLTIREHALGNFAELLRAMAHDGAMLVYLDGVQNQASSINENYAREVMELHTIGRGSYTQRDVTEAARALTGWVVSSIARPRAYRPDLREGESFFVPFRHDAGVKTVLGVTDAHDLDSVIDLLLERPETARFVGRKLFVDLVGLEPDDQELEDVASAFRADYSILALVEAVVGAPAFVSDAALRAKVRSPLEKAVGFMQASGAVEGSSAEATITYFQRSGYLPFNPPNPAGYPKGDVLLGPNQLVHVFDLVALLGRNPGPAGSARELLGRLGLFDVASATVSAIDEANGAHAKWALAVGSPEYTLT